MTPKLTDDMRDALGRDPDETIEVEDELTQRRYVLMPKDAVQEIGRRELLRELQFGFDQADAGEFVAWDPEEIKAEWRRRREGQPGNA